MDAKTEKCNGKAGVTSLWEPVAKFERPTCGGTVYWLMYASNNTDVSQVFSPANVKEYVNDPINDKYLHTFSIKTEDTTLVGTH